jgi:hypothetical protein
VQSVKETPRGVYVGIASIGSEVKDLTNGEPVFLNAEGSLFLKGLIRNRYSDSGAGEKSFDEIAVEALAGAERAPISTDSINLVIMSRRAGPIVTEQTVEGKLVRVFTLDAGRSAIIDTIAAEVAERKTVVVYLAVDSGYQETVEAFINELSEKAGSGVSYPITALTLDTSKTPKRTTRIDGATTGMNWLVALLVLGMIGISAAVVL